MDRQKRSREMLKNVGLNLLNEGKTIRIKAHGYSMYPCIKPGSIILIEPLKIKGPPVPGEIIAVKRESGLVVHRLVKIVRKDDAELFIARGDSNAREDEPVKMSSIIGRIIKAETSGENQVLADIRINKNPDYVRNRLKMIWIILWGKMKRKI